MPMSKYNKRTGSSHIPHLWTTRYHKTAGKQVRDIMTSKCYTEDIVSQWDRLVVFSHHLFECFSLFSLPVWQLATEYFVFIYELCMTLKIICISFSNLQSRPGSWIRLRSTHIPTTNKITPGFVWDHTKITSSQ